VVEHRRVLGLAAEPLDQRLIPSELGEQHLHRHRSVEELVAREEDLGHASTRDRSFDGVAA